MPLNVLTWNLYHGSIQGQTQADRFRQAIAFGIQNGAHLLAFQEVQQSQLQNLLQIAAQSPYTATWSTTEYDPNFHPNASSSSDCYIVLYDPGALQLTAGPNFFYSQYFTQNGGLSYMRPPLQMSFRNPSNATFDFYTWHAETTQGNAAQDSVRILSQLISNTAAASIVTGDLNVTAAFMSGPIFNNWDDISGLVDAQHDGLDHILTNISPVQLWDPPGIEQLHSDARHYAIGARIG